jgi:hypothetical protein
MSADRNEELRLGFSKRTRSALLATTQTENLEVSGRNRYAFNLLRFPIRAMEIIIQHCQDNGIRRKFNRAKKMSEISGRLCNYLFNGSKTHFLY